MRPAVRFYGKVNRVSARAAICSQDLGLLVNPIILLGFYSLTVHRSWGKPIDEVPSPPIELVLKAQELIKVRASLFSQITKWLFLRPVNGRFQESVIETIDNFCLTKSLFGEGLKL